MMASLVDSHCHLNHERMLANHEAVLARAAAQGVARVVVVGCDEPSSLVAVDMAERHAGVFAAVGVHPHDASTYDAGVGERLAALLGRPGVVALGEIGLDFHYNFSSPDEQRRAFEAQLALARERGVSVVVHCREAYGEVLSALEQAKVRGVVHCWSGSPADAERAVACGMHLGFTGIVTFKNAAPIRESARVIPPDRLLVETDAPYLAPLPHRGKQNEPAYLPLVARAVADARGMCMAEVAACTTANAEALFGLPMGAVTEPS